MRLKALLPLWLPWARRRFPLSATVCQQLRAISPRQIDRRLAATKRQLTTRRYGRTKPGTLLKHHIPLKTDHWDVTMPGFTELDLVAHAGHRADGEFAHSLNVTDIHTTWVETRAVLGRGEGRVQAALEEIRQALPFRLRGIDSDNGSEFINNHLYRYCQAQEIQFTRGRPYKKDDNAHIEQKNWTHVRKLVGTERYDTPTAVAAMNALYQGELGLFPTSSCRRSSWWPRSGWGHDCAAGTIRPARRSSGSRSAPRWIPRPSPRSGVSGSARSLRPRGGHRPEDRAAGGSGHAGAVRGRAHATAAGSRPSRRLRRNHALADRPASRTSRSPTTYAGPKLVRRGLHVRWLDDSPLGIFLRWLDRRRHRARRGIRSARTRPRDGDRAALEWFRGDVDSRAARRRVDDPLPGRSRSVCPAGP